MKRTNSAFLQLLGMVLAFNLFFLMACAIAPEPQPEIPDTVIFPNWQHADQVTDTARYTDLWCEIATENI